MIEIKVYGVPASQGSKRHVGHGIMIESSKKLGPWRESVKSAIMQAHPFGQRVDPILQRGAVSIEVHFTMVRPKSAKKGAMPCRWPDIDKLQRSTFDACTQMGVFEDDARIVRCLASKVFPGDVDSLPVPGAIIRISSAVRA